MQQNYDDRANQPPATFDEQTIQEILILGCYDVCKRRGWRLHGVGTDPLHFHWVVSWNEFLPCTKSGASRKTSSVFCSTGSPGKRGADGSSRDGSRKRVIDDAHLKHLLTRYLPDHRGLFWCEGMPLPDDRFEILSS
jgi:hypothetical protein